MMENHRLILAAALAAVSSAAVTAPPETEQYAAKRCSNETLKGTYIYSVTGVRNAQPFSESGMDLYDGNGNIVNTYTESTGDSGRITGTYSINRNCQGTAVFGQETYDLFVSPNGNMFSFIDTNTADGDMTSGIETRAAK